MMIVGAGSCLAALRVPLVEVLEFYREHSRLKAIHAVVIPDFVVQVFLALRVIAERTRAARYDARVRFAVRLGSFACAALVVCLLTVLAFPCFLSGLLASPLCGAALTFFAAA